MASEMLQREDLTAYVFAGLPKSFASKLKKFVEQQGKDGEVMQIDPELTDWLVARLRGEKRRSHETSPASEALWRAYRALSAARYHLQDKPEEEQVRELRRLVEQLWHEISPQFPDPAEESVEDEDEETETK
ncbi:MAG TPA: hypothetical protein VFI96_05070 [Longimicrobiaceae bacterium]|nr:hypothetical protein [Longimicrobiaceae bacterium]